MAALRSSLTRMIRGGVAMLACLATLATTQAAFAQSSQQDGGLQLGRRSLGESDSITGEWLFNTSEFEGDCVIKGKINFKRTQGVPNAYTCTFESEQICGPENDDLYIRVQQSCVAQRVGRQVAITSTVDKVTERRPPYPPNFPPGYGYLADNFVVTLSQSLLEMVGDHYDEQRELKARFWRDVDLVS